MEPGTRIAYHRWEGRSHDVERGQFVRPLSPEIAQAYGTPLALVVLDRRGMQVVEARNLRQEG